MNHLNQDKLIQYAFDLMEQEEKLAVQQHLGACTDCNTALEQLQTKFAAMDMLAADEVPSDELIHKTMSVKRDSVGTAHPTKIPLYRRRWVEWSAAAAAVAIVCILLLQNLPDTRVKETESMWPKQDASKSARQPLAKQDSARTAHPTTTPAMPFPDDRMAALSAKDSVGTNALPLPRGSTSKRGGYSGDVNGVRIVNADAIPDTPPFAPASAIELVVLPKPDKTQVTIYNSADLTLVRDTRKLTLKPGWNWLQFMWDGTLIDPTSLSLTPLAHADRIDIEQLVYPARLKDIARWLIRSEVEGAVPFEITYFASGLSWRAFYMGTMNEDETTMDLKGYVNVSNHSGQDFLNTQTRLIVGQTRLKEDIAFLAQQPNPYGPYMVEDNEGLISNELNFPRNWKEISNKRSDILLGAGKAGSFYGLDMAGGTSLKYDIKELEKTGLSEYFLYTIEGTEDLTNRWAKRLPSFDVENIPVKSLYKYDEDRYGSEAVRFVSFKNDTEHELGETPIPEGTIKIYRNVNEPTTWHGHSLDVARDRPGRESRAGSPCHLSYIGQSGIKYIPVNEDVELNLGPARLVKVEPVLMEQRTENHTFDTKGNIDGWDDIETYKVTIANTRDIPVDIEITWNMGTDAWELAYVDTASTAKDAITYKKHDKNRARFTITLQPKSEKTFSYTVTQYQGRRNENYTNKVQEQEK